MGRGINLAIPITEAEKAALLGRLEVGSIKTETCWLWGGYRRNGYHGALSVHDRPIYVHQLSYAIHFGPIPIGRIVRHECDVGNCWRPEHLLLGNQAQNVADKMARGRHHSGVTKGLAHHMVTLTAEQIREIRRLRAAGVPQREVARQFGVAQSTIWRFVHHIGRQDAIL